MYLRDLNDGIDEHFKKKVFWCIDILMTNDIYVKDFHICKNFAQIDVSDNYYEEDYFTIGYDNITQKYILDIENIDWMTFAIYIFDLLNIPSKGIPGCEDYYRFDKP